ncbi:signal peptide peptidase SppA [Capnocytophaga sp.]|uniref:signal peptide peptidase SppA n=1 Tax=Capnocytophaga sp. TaxID=44737 RepID=UPI0026DB1535|nr:signal peptide peptidase SppA [Capnocytophaga sp.]MDO5105854.1 signal peptide peptidase SppA [Capnocytophaga sp.]
MNFLKNVLASILGCFIALGLIFMFFLVMISVVSASLGTDNSTVTVKDNSVLEIEFKTPLKDYAERVYLEDFDYLMEDFDGLNSVLKAIKYAKTDAKIKGISLKSNNGNLRGIAFIQELRAALEDFKTSGKFVLAYNDIVPQSDYYLQTVADKVYVSPLGELTFRGLSSEVLFFKDIQEKTGVKQQVIRHGKYKSAVEPFLNDKMSDENRQQISELLNAMWQVIVTDVSKSRNVSVEKLNDVANNLLARTPKLALENGLIDGVLFKDEFEQILCEKTGEKQIADLNFINIEDYAESVSTKKKNKSKDKIAVIYAEGDIVYGSGRVGLVSDGVMIESLREATDDEKVKAIVLRINSPGGSALASELIHREIEQVRKHKKVYVSMGNYAASGGYYIACNADRIFAEEGTITGSIGVFGVVPNVSELAEKWGINAEQVTTHAHSLEYSLFEKPSESFIKEATESVENTYNTFIERVASGRKMTPEQVNEVAQGRVWSGKAALNAGLVDEIGNLEKTLAFASAENGLKNYDVVSYPIFTTNVKNLFNDYSTAMKTSFLQQEMGEEAYKMYEKLKTISQQKGVQAQMIFEVNLD